MATRKKGKKHRRICWHIPENSNIYKYFHVSNIDEDVPIWQRLDALLSQAEGNKDIEVQKICDDFVKRIGVYYPGKEQIIQAHTLLLFSLLSQSEGNKDIEVQKIYDDFVRRTCLFYPGKELEINIVRALILKRILKGCKLEDSYYDLLREL